MTDYAEQLRVKLTPEGQKRKRVYTILRHVSASGMTRWISVVIMGTDHRGDPAPIDVSWQVAQIMGYSTKGSHAGFKVQGCGMDMGFHVVYSLGQRLWPDGTPEPHGVRNGDPDRAGGYAIDHSWL